MPRGDELEHELKFSERDDDSDDEDDEEHRREEKTQNTADEAEGQREYNSEDQPDRERSAAKSKCGVGRRAPRREYMRRTVSSPISLSCLVPVLVTAVGLRSTAQSWWRGSITGHRRNSASPDRQPAARSRKDIRAPI